MQIVPSGFHSRKTFSCKERLLCNEKFVVFFSFLYNFLLRYETPHVERPCVLFFFYYHYFIFNFFKRKLKLSHRDGTECTALRIPNRRTIRQIFTAFSSPSIKLPSKRSVSVKKNTNVTTVHFFNSGKYPRPEDWNQAAYFFAWSPKVIQRNLSSLFLFGRVVRCCLFELYWWKKMSFDLGNVYNLDCLFIFSCVFNYFCWCF